jgi:hypothetical protein
MSVNNGKHAKRGFIRLLAPRPILIVWTAAAVVSLWTSPLRATPITFAIESDDVQISDPYMANFSVAQTILTAPGNNGTFSFPGYSTTFSAGYLASFPGSRTSFPVVWDYIVTLSHGVITSFVADPMLSKNAILFGNPDGAVETAQLSTSGGVVSVIFGNVLTLSGPQFQVTPLNPPAQGSGFAITDGNTSSSTLTLVGGSVVHGLQLDLFDLEHDFVGDLSFTLSHLGVTLLFDEPFGQGPAPFGLSGNLDGDYYFSDGASQQFDVALQNADLLSPGLYKPAYPFSVFDGMPAAGDWILSITDHQKGDQGSLGAWQLEFAEVAGVPESSVWALLLTGFGVIGWQYRRNVARLSRP